MKKLKNKMWHVEISDHHSGYVTRRARDDDEWDQDDIAYTHTVLGVRTFDEGEPQYYTGVTVPFQVLNDKEYYLVYVVYSTGDSFHHEEGCVHYVDLFETLSKAEALAKIIETHYSFSYKAQRWADKEVKPPKGYNEYQISYLNEAGEEISTHVPWTGYFESLTNIVIERVRKIPRNGGKIIYR